jgi:hypothetical protein
VKQKPSLANIAVLRCYSGMVYVGEKSSQSCLLLLPIAKKSVKVLKEKVLTHSAEFSRFLFLAPQVSEASNRIVADVNIPAGGAEGVLMTQGGWFVFGSDSARIGTDRSTAAGLPLP